MANVYGQVNRFYDGHMEAEHILPMDLVERYFRQNAWQGASDRKLKAWWSVLSETLRYIMEMKLYDLSSLTIYDYQEIVYRVAEKRKDVALDEKNIQKILDFYDNFYQYMANIDFMDLREYFQEARKSFYESGKFAMPERRQVGNFYSTLEHLEEITPEDMEELNAILARILRNVGEYFHQPKFFVDLARAVMLFGGPGHEQPDEEDAEAKESFWFSFWDYFMFDYHLLETDETPLQHFYASEKARLDPTDLDIIRDLLRAKFTVFYIEDMDGEYASCRDMFTDEVIELPAPDAFLPDYRRMVLYGHIHARGVMLLNYITTLPASSRLRKRMKDEILRQFELFKYQEPDATREMFFSRQAAAVRHTIRILSEFAQLKVVPMKHYPAPIVRDKGLSVQYAAAEKRLEDAAAKVGFGHHGIRLLLKFYEDFLTCSSLSEDMKRRASVLTAVLLVFSGINGVNLMDIKGGMDVLGADREDVLGMAPEIETATRCISFDPRYLTEEGFVQILFQ